MVAIQQNFYITPEEYLDSEAHSPVKHEYCDGDVYAMAGAKDGHVTIAGNLFAVLRAHVRGSNCRVFISDMKARIEKKNCYYYPDVMVTCDERDRDSQTFKSHPKLIIEVLSDSTEGFDRGNKFKNYRTLDSLEEYVLVSQTHAQVDCFRRNEAGQWVLYSFELDDPVQLESVGLSIDMTQIYEDVTFPEPEPQTEICT
jgi:Uma2 family endonuclease